MYKYETHCHTSPASLCGQKSPEEVLKFYKQKGYDGVFITNHFLDGNIGCDRSLGYNEQIEFYFTDYEKAIELSEAIGIKVFLGVEISYGGTDFMIIGLDKEWYLNHPEIMTMRQRDKLNFYRENGAFVIQNHPYREAEYIECIRLFPRSVDAVEVINASCTDLANKMANVYAENYGLCKTAGSDNHVAGDVSRIAGIITKNPINSEADYINAVKNGEIEIFHEENK